MPENERAVTMSVSTVMAAMVRRRVVRREEGGGVVRRGRFSGAADHVGRSEEEPLPRRGVWP